MHGLMVACAPAGGSEAGSGEASGSVTSAPTGAATGVNTQSTSSSDMGSASDVGATASTTGTADSEDSSDPTEVPRLLLIIADDFGIDSALPYGDGDLDGMADDGREYAPMPHVTRLCRDGLRFRQA